MYFFDVTCSQDVKKINKKIAKFNIDLLVVLQEKTKNNLSADEKNFLDTVVQDLQLKFVEAKF